MDDRLVLADSGPLIALAAVECFETLRGLFGHLSVTTSVRGEVLARADVPGAPETSEAISAGWISVLPDPPMTDEPLELGKGEASTLALARAHQGPCLVLMDDRVARLRARDWGLTVSGVGGVLVAARRAGLLDEVGPILERLTSSGFRLSDEVAKAILEAAGSR